MSRYFFSNSEQRAGTVFITRLKEALYYYACAILKRKELSRVTVEVIFIHFPYKFSDRRC